MQQEATNRGLNAELFFPALLAAPRSPVLGHGQMLQQGEPAGGQAVQAGDAVVVQQQLSEEDLVVQPGRLEGVETGGVGR